MKVLLIAKVVLTLLTKQFEVSKVVNDFELEISVVAEQVRLFPVTLSFIVGARLLLDFSF